MKMFFDTLSEKERRRNKARKAMKRGNGGQQYICETPGCDPSTVKKGILKFEEKRNRDNRIRQPDG